jgi:hypothetical protein
MAGLAEILGEDRGSIGVGVDALARVKPGQAER